MDFCVKIETEMHRYICYHEFRREFESFDEVVRALCFSYDFLSMFSTHFFTLRTTSPDQILTWNLLEAIAGSEGQELR